MTEETSTTSHLSVAMTTDETNKPQTTDGNTIVSSSSVIGSEFYMTLAVVVIGAVGTVGNALILYALFASKQHKKHLLIVNQNVLDLFASFFLCLTFAVRMFYVPLTGQLGHWLCVTFLSEILIWLGTNGSMINLGLITIDRYLMVVHPVRSKKWLRPWVIRSAMATAWLLSIVYNTVHVFHSTNVVDGDCVSYVIPNNDLANMAAIIAYILFFYFIILAIFLFCYWRILLAIRRQAKVMASHSAAGTSNARQVQSHRIQNNVIKTMVLVSALYVIAWMPHNVYYLLAAAELIPYLSFFDSRYYALTFIAFLCTTTNPFIYATKFNDFHPVTLVA